MKCKEDLIGTEWKCTECKRTEIITINGIVHSCPHYYVHKILDSLWKDYKNMELHKEQEKSILWKIKKFLKN